MKGHHPDSPPTAAAASAASAPPSSSAKTSSSPPSASTAADPFSALITPSKHNNSPQQQQAEQLSKKEKKRQLQLTIQKAGSSVGDVGKVVLKNKKKKSSSTNAAAVASTAPSANSGREGTLPNNNSNKPSSVIKYPPVSSLKSLPPLAGRVEDLLRAETTGSKGKLKASDTIEFEVNQECTSIGLVPSGRIAVAGFTDGTLRLFDLTGIFAKDKHHPDNAIHNRHGKKHKKKESNSEALFDDDASSSSEDEEENSFGSEAAMEVVSGGGKIAKTMSVNSHANQMYGAVACQIHARGVHTSLLMDVAVSEDGLYAFGGVQRGSVELAAVYLGDVESYLDERQNNQCDKSATETPGLLDLIQVDRHADAKLKGFGACTRLWNGWERARSGVERPEYLLFTGKGIKNIHIWSYKPSRIEKGEESVWTCLYDTPGNGTSINQLYFRHNGLGTLQGISKSDDQKLRVWDLSYEQKRVAIGADGSDRPKRPDYVDVASTEGTIGVCGPYAFASGSLGGMHNIINVVGLDADDVSSPFNCTELALPGGNSGGDAFVSSRPSRTGRQQRGDLKSVVNVAGLVFDASHALLQLSDGSVVHYLHDQAGHPMLLQSPSSLCTTCIDDDSSFGLTCTNQNKRISLARVGSQGMVMFACSSFNENTSRGAIVLRALPGTVNDTPASKHRRYWGFNGLKKKRKQTMSRTSSISSETASGAPPTVESTPAPSAKSSKKASPATDVSPMPTQVAKPDKSSRQGKKRPSEGQTGPDVMDVQLEQKTPAAFTKNTKKVTEFKKRVPWEGSGSGKMESIPEATPAPSAKDIKKPFELSNKSCKKRTSEDVADCTPVPAVTKGQSNKDISVKKVTPGDFTPAPASKPVANTGNVSCPSKKHSEEQESTMDSQLESIVQVYNQETVHSPKRSSNATDVKGTTSNDMPRKKQKTVQAKQTESDPQAVVAVNEPTPTSPKKRVRRKTASPKSSPTKDRLSDEKIGSSPSDYIVGFVGMTILDRRVQKALPESCYQPKQHPSLLVDQLPSSTISNRLTNVKAAPKFTTDVRFKRQCDERQTLAAKHRAEHEMLRKKVLHSIRYVLSTWDIELNSTRSHASIVDSAKKWFDEALADHQDMLDDMLDRQTMEAESLAARHTAELTNKHAPTLRVSFPFPEVFEQARQELLSILQSMK